jgi:membrane-associated phospholipid phosphatase
MPLLSGATRARIAEFDRRVDAAFAPLRGHAVADRLFYAASELGDFGLIWLMLGAARGLRSEHDWHAAVRVGGAIGAESVLVNLGIKSLFRRARPPWEVDRPLRLRRPRTSSFPSGHATAGFTAATLLSEDDPLWPIYYGIATVVAVSRVYVRIHHASDVVGGIGLGLVLGRIARRLVPLPVRPAPGSPAAAGLAPR